MCVCVVSEWQAAKIASINVLLSIRNIHTSISGSTHSSLYSMTASFHYATQYTLIADNIAASFRLSPSHFILPAKDNGTTVIGLCSLACASVWAKEWVCMHAQYVRVSRTSGYFGQFSETQPTGWYPRLFHLTHFFLSLSLSPCKMNSNEIYLILFHWII